MIEPTGSYVLIKATMIEKVSEGGIVMPEDLIKKEQMVERTGEVVAIGPCAYVDWAGCDVEGKTPAECWGIKVGDMVEHKRYEAEDSVMSDDETIYRYMRDVDIRGVIND